MKTVVSGEKGCFFFFCSIPALVVMGVLCFFSLVSSVPLRFYLLVVNCFVRFIPSFRIGSERRIHAVLIPSCWSVFWFVQIFQSSLPHIIIICQRTFEIEFCES